MRGAHLTLQILGQHSSGYFIKITFTWGFWGGLGVFWGVFGGFVGGFWGVFWGFLGVLGRFFGKVFGKVFGGFLGGFWGGVWGFGERGFESFFGEVFLVF